MSYGEVQRAIEKRFATSNFGRFVRYSTSPGTVVVFHFATPGGRRKQRYFYLYIE